MYRLIVLSRLDGVTKWAGDVSTVKQKNRVQYQCHATQTRAVDASVALGALADTEPEIWPALLILNMASHGETLTRALHVVSQLKTLGRLPPEIPDVPPTELLKALCAEHPASSAPSPATHVASSHDAPPPLLFRQKHPTAKRWLAPLPTPDLQVQSTMPASRITTIFGPPGSGKTSVAPLCILGLLEQRSPHPVVSISRVFVKCSESTKTSTNRLHMSHQKPHKSIC